MKVEILTVLFSCLSLRVISLRYSDVVYLLASFGLDLLIILWALARLSVKADFIFKPSKRLAALAVVFALGGWGTHFLATRLGLAIPFDISSLTVNVILLTFIPVFEELIFRQSLWRQLEALHFPKVAVWLITSILFALYHLKDLRIALNQETPFIYYQTGYALLFGLALGWVRQKEASVTPCILLHAAFNLGFGLGVIA